MFLFVMFYKVEDMNIKKSKTNRIISKVILAGVALVIAGAVFNSQFVRTEATGDEVLNYDNNVVVFMEWHRMSSTSDMAEFAEYSYHNQTPFMLVPIITYRDYQYEQIDPINVTYNDTQIRRCVSGIPHGKGDTVYNKLSDFEEYSYLEKKGAMSILCMDKVDQLGTMYMINYPYCSSKLGRADNYKVSQMNWNSDKKRSSVFFTDSRNYGYFWFVSESKRLINDRVYGTMILGNSGVADYSDLSYFNMYGENEFDGVDSLNTHVGAMDKHYNPDYLHLYLAHNCVSGHQEQNEAQLVWAQEPPDLATTKMIAVASGSMSEGEADQYYEKII